MDHLKALLLKLISSFVLLYIVFGIFTDMSVGRIFFTSLMVGVISYIIGDRLILPRSNNLVATIADFGLAFLIMWLLNRNEVLTWNLYEMTLIAALGLTLFEYFFHNYLSRNTDKKDRQRNEKTAGNLQYQTEAAEELAPNEVENLKNRE